MRKEWMIDDSNYEDPEPPYSELDITRSQQLDKVSDLLSRSIRLLQGSDSHRVIQGWYNGRNKYRETIITPQFLYGVWRVQQTLVSDLSETGHKETVADILIKYERRG